MSIAERSTLSRRKLLETGAAAGVILVAGRLGSDEVLGQGAAVDTAALNAWIAVNRDGTITLQCAHSEMGQGIETTFAAILADELEGDWTRVKVVFSPAAPPFRHPVYNWQFTGNSESIRSYHALLRKMGAAAREMLVAAAAARFKVEPSALTTREGVVRHAQSGRSIGYGTLAADAAKLPVPETPKLKPASEWRLVGNGRSLPRIDIPAKVDGTAVYGIDVKVPGMVHAAVISAPTIGGTITSVDDALVRTMSGVLAVVPLGSAVAVVAEHWWQARVAIEKLSVSWSDGQAGRFDTGFIDGLYRKALAGDAWAVAEHHGDAAAVLKRATRVLEAEYWSPWQSHAPMEPMNATVSVTADSATVWAPTQGPQMTQVVLAAVLKIDPEKVTVNRTYLGGGFGRRLLADYTAQAALCSKAVGRPVKLIWHREEDFKQDVYRPGLPDAHSRKRRKRWTPARATPAHRRADDPWSGFSGPAEAGRRRSAGSGRRARAALCHRQQSRRLSHAAGADPHHGVANYRLRPEHLRAGNSPRRARRPEQAGSVSLSATPAGAQSRPRLRCSIAPPRWQTGARLPRAASRASRSPIASGPISVRSSRSTW